jgi:hypothetical protein
MFVEDLLSVCNGMVKLTLVYFESFRLAQLGGVVVDVGVELRVLDSVILVDVSVCRVLQRLVGVLWSTIESR